MTDKDRDSPSLLELQVDARLKEAEMKAVVDSPLTIVTIGLAALAFGYTVVLTEGLAGAPVVIAGLLILFVVPWARRRGGTTIAAWLDAERAVTKAKEEATEGPRGSAGARQLDVPATSGSRVGPRVGAVVLVGVIVGLLARRSPRG